MPDLVAEWLTACENFETTAFLSCHLRGHRLERMFAVACCHRIWHLLTDERSRNAVRVAERFADGLANGEELNRAGDAAVTAAEAIKSAAEEATRAAWSAITRPRSAEAVTNWSSSEIAASAMAAVAAADLTEESDVAVSVAFAAREAITYERQAQGLLLAAIVGPQVVHWLPAWNTGVVIQLARHIYDNHEWELMPILADALEEAGCDNSEVLIHCRTVKAHCRGDWVLDYALSKRP